MLTSSKHLVTKVSHLKTLRKLNYDFMFLQTKRPHSLKTV